MKIRKGELPMHLRTMITVGVMMGLLLATMGGSIADVPPTLALSDRNPNVRIDAFQRIGDLRAQLVSDLVKILESKEPNTDDRGPLSLAIRLLATLRAPEAVPGLCARLMFLPTGRVVSELQIMQMYYPCAQALIGIGQPSIAPMLGIIRESKAVEERELAAWVIMQIEGKEQCLHRLTTLISSGSPESSQFRAASEFISSYKPKFGFPGSWRQLNP